MAADFFHSLEKEIIKKRDFSLIKSTLSGNHKSFGMLMALYKLRIVSFGRSFFKDERDIEDFVQDVFIKVYLNLATFKGESMFSTWLIRIAYTTAINSVKRRKENHFSVKYSQFYIFFFTFILRRYHYLACLTTKSATIGRNLM